MENNFSELNIKNENIKKIFGTLDENIKRIEQKFNVSIVERNGTIKILGNNKDTDMAKKVLVSLNKLCENNESITPSSLDYFLSIKNNEDKNKFITIDNDVICKTFQGKPIKAKTLNQGKYIDSIINNMITFGIGPAGTGKTFLAICMAVKYLRNNEVERIVLTRPAIEAGEKLGFLPGDLQNKIDPYLRPLYDALYTTIGFESFNQYSEKGIIEVVPLAYMRGRTLDSAFIILDEAQNTTFHQMKMFLTRVGFNSKVIVTGDITQIDLPQGTASGLVSVEKILKNIENIGFINLTSIDIVRHPIIQKIVNAYEKYENKSKK